MIIEKHIFTGGSSNKIYLILPLTITTSAIDTFIIALQESLAELKQQLVQITTLTINRKKK
jgi:acetylornithine aminotransferase